MAQIGLLEDNPRIANMCATMLSLAGHKVTIYKHPNECLHDLLHDGQLALNGDPQIKRVLPVELLILDLHLPDIDGLEVLHQLQSHPQTQLLPLVFCTAASPYEIARAIRVAPKAALVEKPFKLETLTGAIITALATVGKIS